jgi:hypothetical protein
VLWSPLTAVLDDCRALVRRKILGCALFNLPSLILHRRAPLGACANIHGLAILRRRVPIMAVLFVIAHDWSHEVVTLLASKPNEI